MTPKSISFHFQCRTSQLVFLLRSIFFLNQSPNFWRLKVPALMLSVPHLPVKAQSFTIIWFLCLLKEFHATIIAFIQSQEVPAVNFTQILSYQWLSINFLMVQFFFLRLKKLIVLIITLLIVVLRGFILEVLLLDNA